MRLAQLRDWFFIAAAILGALCYAAVLLFIAYSAPVAGLVLLSIPVLFLWLGKSFTLRNAALNKLDSLAKRAGATLVFGGAAIFLTGQLRHFSWDRDELEHVGTLVFWAGVFFLFAFDAMVKPLIQWLLFNKRK